MMIRHRSTRKHKSNLLRSTPDLTADSKSDKSRSSSPRSSSWRTHSANSSHKSSSSETKSRLTDSPTSSEDHSLTTDSVSNKSPRSSSLRTRSAIDTNKSNNSDGKSRLTDSSPSSEDHNLTLDSMFDKSPRNNSWRTRSAVGPHKSGNSDARNRLADSTPSSEDHNLTIDSSTDNNLSPRNTWRTRSAIVPHKHNNSDTRSRFTDSSPSSDDHKLTIDSALDSSPRNSWRTRSAMGPHKHSNSDSRNRLADSSPSSEDHSGCSPSRRPRAVSPHHNRSLSFRTMKRPTPHQIQCEDSACTGTTTGFRPRGSTMPSDSASYYLARRRMRSRQRYDTSNNLTPSPPIHEPGDDEDDEYYLLRSFSINSKGAIVNMGDFLRQRSRSNNSVASTTSSLTPGGNNTSYSSGEQSRGPTSKVQILGASDVGKTTLINQFMTSEYMNAYETQDEDMEKCVSVLLDGVEYELIFLDDPLPVDNMVLEAVNEEAGAFIVTYAVTDRASFEKAVDILFSLRERGATMTKAVILVANKSDLARTREVSVEEGKSIAYSYECKFVETSAAINHNVDELLVGVVSQIRLKNKQKEEGFPKSKNNASPSKGLSSPRRKHGGSMKGTLRSSLKTKGLINRLLGKSGKSKSCENLHVL